MNPYQKYQQQMVNTMTQGESLLMLYDETLKQMDIARNAIVTGKTGDMDKALEKAEKITERTQKVRVKIGKNTVEQQEVQLVQ